MEKLKSERCQPRRAVTKMYNDVSSLLTNEALTNDDISLLTSTTRALHDQFHECLMLEKELLTVILGDIQNEKELDTFFDKVTKVTNANQGKFNRLTFFLTERERTNPKPPVSHTQLIVHTTT